MRRPRRKPEEARALLIDAARAELLENDGDFQLVRVTRRAGVSPGLPRHYFGSKAGLLAAVVEDYLQRLDAEVSRPEVDPKLPWQERERKRVECYVEFLAREPLSRYLMGSLAGSPEVLALITASLDRHIEEGARNFGQGQAMGVVRKNLPPDVLSAAVHGAIRQITQRALRAHGGIERRLLVDHVWALIETWLVATTHS